MKFFYLIFFVLLISTSNTVSSQVVFDKTAYDFGEISNQSNRFIDVFLKNKTNDVAFILSVKRPNGIIYIQKNAMILQDSSSIIRFQVNPSKKGKFKYEIPVYTSDKETPTMIVLKGVYLESPSNSIDAFTACPNFNQSPSEGNPLDFELTVLTIDEQTKEPLGKSIVNVLQGGERIESWTTKKDGQYTDKVPLGFTYFYATHEGYYPAELGSYINFQRNFITLSLTKIEKDENNETNEIIEDETALFTRDTIDFVEETNENEDFSAVNNEIPIHLDDLDESNFNEKYFNPVNVVFVIDVSSSMKQADKMELMKYALFSLTDMLRPQDKIGLVSYATETKVVLPSISGAEKEQIKEAVRNMKAVGLTAGGAGIKLGFKLAKRNQIKEGKNHVIIITDGSFNRASGDYQKYISKYQRKGITMSVIGIKNDTQATENMTQAASLGSGRYIPIHKLKDAEKNLNQEIRITTFKY